ncbi:hypothetical protein GPJ56_010605 [Histomonas meleagridis]|uniref:uncharacterized protein n=1 Tax=Histomonas meleagridis TaxID=135588 RepID=UPI00355ACC16|nr:hypothetical protein GPJ56_010605 [Histomonas meleagridis]KAH0804000.1 hypothetical protein GO595_002830 [Histomonas meleagridis]
MSDHSDKSSSSSYDVPEPVQEPVQEPPKPEEPACKIGGSCGGCCPLKCCRKCPCEAFKPENIQTTLEKNEKLVHEVQAMIMFKRPIPFAILLVFVNLCFCLYRVLDLNFYAFVTLVAIIRLLFKIFGCTIKSIVLKTFFGGEIPKGDGSNRIRSIEEVKFFLNKVLAPLFNLQKIIKKLASDDSVTGLLIYAGILFFAFVLTAAIDFFWPVVILVNLLLILPGVLLHPLVLEQIQKIKGKAAQQAPKEEKEEKKEKDLKEKAADLKEKMEEKAEDLKEKMEKKAEDLKEKMEEKMEEKKEEIKENLEEKKSESSDSEKKEKSSESSDSEKKSD